MRLSLLEGIIMASINAAQALAQMERALHTNFSIAIAEHRCVELEVRLLAVVMKRMDLTHVAYHERETEWSSKHDRVLKAKRIITGLRTVHLNMGIVTLPEFIKTQYELEQLPKDFHMKLLVKLRADLRSYGRVMQDLQAEGLNNVAIVTVDPANISEAHPFVWGTVLRNRFQDTGMAPWWTERVVIDTPFSMRLWKEGVVPEDLRWGGGKDGKGKGKDSKGKGKGAESGKGLASMQKADESDSSVPSQWVAAPNEITAK